MHTFKKTSSDPRIGAIILVSLAPPSYSGVLASKFRGANNAPIAGDMLAPYRGLIQLTLAAQSTG